MDSATTQRFDKLQQGVDARSVLLVGAGTIGSYTGLALAKAGFALTVYDPDAVEAPNVGVQLYNRGNIGSRKVDALYGQLVGGAPEDQEEITVIGRSFRLTYANLRQRIQAVVLAVDSIEARRHVLGILTHSSHVPARHTGNPITLIDARMSFDTVEFHIHTIGAGEDTKAQERLTNYLRCLTDTTQTYAEEACGSESHPGAGMYCGAVISSALLAIANKRPVPHTILGSLSTFETVPFWVTPEDEKAARAL